MSSIIPSPPQNASATRRGLVSLLAQSFAGAKTFLAAVVMSAGLSVTGAISATTKFRSGIGSGTDVAYGPTGDDNTGIWFPASDTINFVSGGTLRCQLTSTGTWAFQGPASFPTNSLVSIGAFQSYESPSGTLNMGAVSTIIKLGAILQLNDLGHARPTANAANRGKLWYSKSAGGAADTVEICLKSAADTYAWVVVATG